MLRQPNRTTASQPSAAARSAQCSLEAQRTCGNQPETGAIGVPERQAGDDSLPNEATPRSSWEGFAARLPMMA